MITLLLLSHGPLAQGLLESLRMFWGDLDQVSALSLDSNERPDSFYQRIEGAVQGFQSEDVLILTDIPGGSPCNQALIYCSTHPQTQVVSGLNLMMALDACVHRSNMTLDELAHYVKDSAIASIQNIQMPIISSNTDEDVLF
jgi:mannose/fructose-specific phosphotransferase system component IIA